MKLVPLVVAFAAGIVVTADSRLSTVFVAAVIWVGVVWAGRGAGRLESTGPWTTPRPATGDAASRPATPGDAAPPHAADDPPRKSPGRPLVVTTIACAFSTMAGAVCLQAHADHPVVTEGLTLVELQGFVAGPVRREFTPASRATFGVAESHVTFDLHLTTNDGTTTADGATADGATAGGGRTDRTTGSAMIGRPSFPPGTLVRCFVAGSEQRPPAGSRVRVVGQLSIGRAAANPGERLRRPLAAEPRYTLRVGHPSALTVLSSGPLPRLRDRFRQAVRSLLRQNLSPTAAGLARALLLGERDGLSYDLQRRFRQTGLAHLLAISGLHVGIIAVVLLGPLNRLPVTGRVRFALFAAALIGFAWLVQPTVSVTRATACAILLAFGSLYGHAWARLDHLACVLLGYLLFDPQSIFAPGLQLSFTATAAIIVIRRKRLVARCMPQRLRASELELAGWGRRGLAKATELAIWSVLLWLVTAPLMAFHFRWVTPLGFVLNIACLPLVTVLVGILAVALVAAIWLGGLATPLWVAAEIVATGFAGLVGWLDPGPFLLPVAEWDGRWVAGLYGLTLAAFTLKAAAARWAKRLTAAWALMAVVVVMWPAAAGPVRCTVLSVGHGLAVLVQSDAGHAVLCDAGSLSDADRTGDRIADALRDRGVQRLDALLISHADLDHFSAVPSLLDRFTVRRVLVHETFLQPDSPQHEALLQKLVACRVPLEPIGRGDRLRLGSATAEILHPEWGEVFEDDNANSLVVRLATAGGSMLLPGDLEGEGQAFFLLTQPSPVDVLVAPHHGSAGSNTPELAAALQPRVVIVSDSQPARPAVAAVYRRSIRLDQATHGAVTVELPSDGPPSVATFRTQRRWTLPPRPATLPGVTTSPTTAADGGERPAN